MWYDNVIYALCLKKTVQICFCMNFVKFPPILIICGRKMAKRLKLCEVHSFSTSPTSHLHNTVLNTDVPNCYTMLNVVICSKLCNDLVKINEWKSGLFCRIIGSYNSSVQNCNSSVQNCQKLCSKCSPHTWTHVLRRWWHRLIVASTIDWSNCSHSSIRCVLSSSTSAGYPRTSFFVFWYDGDLHIEHMPPSRFWSDRHLT